MAVDKNKIIAEATKLVQKGSLDKAITTYQRILAEDRQGRPRPAQGRRAVPEEGRREAGRRRLHAGGRDLRRAGLLPQGGRGLQADREARPGRRPGERAARRPVPAARAHERRHGPAPVHGRRPREGRRRREAHRRPPADGGARPGEHRLLHQAGRAPRPRRTARAGAGVPAAGRRVPEEAQPHRRVPQGGGADRLARRATTWADQGARQHLPGQGRHQAGPGQAPALLQGRTRRTWRRCTCLAQAFRDLGQTTKTLSVYKELAHVHEEQGRHADARATWRKVQELAPDDPDAGAALGAARRTPTPPRRPLRGAACRARPRGRCVPRRRSRRPLRPRRRGPPAPWPRRAPTRSRSSSPRPTST